MSHLKNRLISIAVGVGMVVVAFITLNCSSLPAMTQTGKVEEIVIGAAVVPLEVTLSPGDEVRWVNRQDGPVQIVFLDPIQEQVTCGRGFGLAGVTNAVWLSPDKGVSVCFAGPTVIRYTVRLDTPTLTGQIHILGVVQIQPINN